MKRRLFRIIIALSLFVLGIIAGRLDPLYGSILTIAAYALAGYDILWRAAFNIVRGKVFDENFLMSIATIGAFALGDFSEGAAVMLFYQVGELFQSYAVGRSRKSIAELMDIRPDCAYVKRDGELVKLDPYDVKIGDIMVIKPGEKVPLDGVITSGSTSLNTAALTGESMPREASLGDSVLSGTININGVIEARVEKEFYDCTVSKILDLVENAANKKSQTENFITRFARWYTPAVVIAAALLAVLPPLVLSQPFAPWVKNALIFLVVSCPCALVISIPLSFFGGIGGSSRKGILVKGGNYLEALAKCEIAVFDKTGTLTKGSFEVQSINAVSAKCDLLELAAHAESSSNHPIARAILQAYGKAVDRSRIANMQESAGFGISCDIDGKSIFAGNGRLMEAHGKSYDKNADGGTIVHLATADEYLGNIIIADSIKDDAKQAITALKAAGIKRTVMLTGDSDAVAQRVAQQLGLDEVHSQLLPQDKVACMEELMAQRSAKGKLVFVGDGINDAPVLARADIGIAMGGIGSDAAIEAADVVIMTDEPSKIAQAIKISKKTLNIATQNIIFALAVKGLVLIFGAAGHATMWEAVFADVGVAVLAILNSARAMKK